MAGIIIAAGLIGFAVFIAARGIVNTAKGKGGCAGCGRTGECCGCSKSSGGKGPDGGQNVWKNAG